MTSLDKNIETFVFWAVAVVPVSVFVAPIVAALFKYLV